MSSESEDQERIAHIEARIAHWKGSPSDGPLYLQDEFWLLTRLRTVEAERDAARKVLAKIHVAVDTESVPLGMLESAFLREQRRQVRAALSVPVVEDGGDSA